MHMPATRIIARHRETLRGQLILKTLRSAALGIAKPYYLYEPPGLDFSGPVHLLYLFRGHEREWVNWREDQSRVASTAIEDLDRLIARGLLPPVVAVLPGLSSSNNWIPSLGINMVGTWAARFRGLGSGRFWDYLISELLPAIDRRYPRENGGKRLMAGFSLGGYTVSLLASKLPGYFDAAGMYDGTFMWSRHRDPRVGDAPFTDRIWCKSGLFDAALGRPRQQLAMQTWNATDLLQRAAGEHLTAMRKTTFWVASAARDGGFGNRDRARNFARLLKKQKLPMVSRDIILHENAAHTWHWADRFLIEFLFKILAAAPAELAFRPPATSDRDTLEHEPFEDNS